MGDLENGNAPVRVILLEDSDLDAQLVIARLERSGLRLQVGRARDRATYYALLNEQEHDLILADYALPDFDGLAALKAARALRPHLPFIFLSGRVGEEVAIETMQKGATDYVLKQRMERLVPAVTRALKEAEEHATRKRAEELFAQSESRFRGVMDALPQRVWVTTAAGEMLYVNKAWREHAPAGLTSWLDPRITIEQDRPLCLECWRTALATHEAFSCECRLRSHGGEYRWHLVRMVPLSDTRTANGNPCIDWLGTATDLQEQKLNEEALRTAEKLAVIGRLSASIAHEINNPLESLTNLIYLARLEARESPRVLEYLDMTENELARMAAITKQTLQFYRDPLSPTAVNAREILEDVLRLFRTRLMSKRIQYTLDAEDEICFDAIQGEIRQVLINLLGNAIDAVQHEGSIHAQARLVQEGARAMVELQIEDDGVGISPAQVGRLFQPFVSTKGAHGTGLGLWVSKGIVEKHEGTIRLATHPLEGGTVTRATVRLPLKVEGHLVADRSANVI